MAQQAWLSEHGSFRESEKADATRREVMRRVPARRRRVARRCSLVLPIDAWCVLWRFEMDQRPSATCAALTFFTTLRAGIRTWVDLPFLNLLTWLMSTVGPYSLRPLERERERAREGGRRGGGGDRRREAGRLGEQLFAHGTGGARPSGLRLFWERHAPIAGGDALPGGGLLCARDGVS